MLGGVWVNPWALTAPPTLQPETLTLNGLPGVVEPWRLPEGSKAPRVPILPESPRRPDVPEGPRPPPECPVLEYVFGVVTVHTPAMNYGTQPPVQQSFYTSAFFLMRETWAESGSVPGGYHEQNHRD